MMLRADIATGGTTLDRLDVRLPGPMPLVLRRTYRSDGPPGIFGLGWQHGLDRALRVEAERLVYREAGSPEVAFAPVPVGMEARHPSGLVLQHHADAYVVYTSPLVQEVFRKGAGETLPLDCFEDPNGNRIQLTYAGGRLSEVTDSAGRRVRFVYAGTQVGQLVLIGPGGQAEPFRVFRYGSDGALVRETDAAGQHTDYTYRGGLLVGVAGPAGFRLFAQYDAQKRCLALWRGDGTGAQHFAYDPVRQATRAVGLDGSQTIYRHVAGRQVLEAVRADGESVNFYYDEAQRLIGHSVAGGSVATFQRLDPETRTVFQVDHETRLAEAQCGESGLVEAVSDAFGNRYALAYDERYNLVGLTTPLAATWRFERDRQGRVAAIESPEGRGLRLHRTATELTVEDAAGVRLRCTSDGRGRVVKRAARGEGEQRFRYDAEGRLTAVETEAGFRLSLDYDGAGRLVRAADSERRTARWQRDAAGRVLALDTGEGPLRLRRDAAGRVAAVAGPRGELRFAYDEQGRLATAEGELGRVSFDYAAGAVTVRDGARARTFNLLGDLLESEADGAVCRFGYGPSGEVLTAERVASHGTQTRVFDYDADGRLARVADDALELAFTYDRDGMLANVRNGSGVLAALSYDARLRPTGLDVDGVAYRLDFGEGDRLASVQGPSGSSLAVRYDASGRPSSEPGPGRDGALEFLRLGDGGLALAVRTGETAVPVWGRDRAPSPVRPVGEWLVEALAFGAGEEPETGGRPEARRWTAWSELLCAFCTEVPCAEALAVPWPALDLFALARSYYDPLHTLRLPGVLPYHEPEPDVDDWVTGSHRTGRLRSCVWESRSYRPRPRRAEGFLGVGAPGAEAALSLYRALGLAERSPRVIGGLTSR